MKDDKSVYVEKYILDEEIRLKAEHRITTDPEKFLRNNVSKTVEDYRGGIYLICEDGTLITFMNRIGKAFAYKQTPWKELKRTLLSIDDLLYEWDLPNAEQIDFLYNRHRMTPLKDMRLRSKKETYWVENGHD